MKFEWSGKSARDAWLRSDPDLQRVCLEVADRGVRIAQGLAPVDDGAYRRSLRSEPSKGWNGRVAADIVADVPYAAAIEFGKKRTKGRGQHVLKRTLGQLDS